MGFLRRWKKVKKLIEISRCLGAWSAPNATAYSVLNSANSAQSFRELLQLVENDRDCAPLLEKYKANAKTLQDLFRELESGGADCWVKHLYIPCVAIADPRTLDYLLRVRARTGRAIGKTVSALIVAFYQQGAPLLPPPFDHDGEPLVTPPYTDF